ncbi:L-serine ammonia-lyase, iron-sulfur-dependent subunit beta [Treponema sp.]
MSKDTVSIFDILGPVMIGPSSSHTAGVARIAFLARKMFAGKPDQALVKFYGSLASTWRGHGSDKAAIAGLLGIPPEDERLARGAALLEEAKAAGEGFTIELNPIHDLPSTWHPNTIVIELEAKGHKQRMRAASVGGGSIRIEEIDGYRVNLSGALDALLVLHHDEIGVIAIVSHMLAANRINIAGTSSHRKEKGDEALLVVETDGPIPLSVVQQIEGLPPIYTVIKVPALGV